MGLARRRHALGRDGDRRGHEQGGEKPAHGVIVPKKPSGRFLRFT
jgi:hypothetical protein